MSYNEDEEPPPPRPGPARPTRPVLLTKHHNSDAPLAFNEQKVLLELNGVTSAASRASLDLVAVIDISSSMEGVKLDNAKKALTFIVRKLTDRDRLSIVQFDHEASCVCHLRRITEAARAELEAKISGLQTRGTTNIAAGLITALAVVKDRKFTAGRSANIMLLSDGMEIHGHARSVETGDVPVHTFGFGGSHDPTLLGAIAKKSLGGVYNYVADSNDPAKLSDAFSRILAGLVTIIAQDLELTVKPFPDEAIINKVDAGIYPADLPRDGTSPVTVRFGTLYSEESRTVVIDLALRESTKSRSYLATVAQVEYRFTTAQGQAVTSDPERITIKRSGKVTATADVPSAVEVEVIRLEHVNSIRKAVETADKDRVEEAWNILMEALRKLVEAQWKLVHPILQELQNELMELLALFKTKDLYKMQGRPRATALEVSHGRRRSAETGDNAAGLYDTQRVKDYRKKAEQPLQEAYVSSPEEDEQEEAEREAAPRSPATEMRTISVALRLLTAVLSLLAFSILASARTSGWAGEYYSRYKPYRYTVGVNVIVCFYSLAQAFVETRRPASPRFQTISCYCITLFLDQGLAYLLMSASSAAASRHHLWVLRFGKDQFNGKVVFAVWFSFLAFLALSGNALISTMNLFSRM